MPKKEGIVKNEELLERVRDKIKENIEHYRAASDAPAKVDVFDVIEEVFSIINPNLNDETKISIDEASGCLRNAYFDRKDPAERTHKQMMSSIIKKAALSVLEKPVDGELEIAPNLKLTGRADRVEDDIVMIFRSVQELPEMPSADHFMQINTYLHMFNKEEGVIIYFDGEGNEMEFIVPKSPKLLHETFRRVRILNTLLRNSVIPALEPSPNCLSCPYNEKCYYPSEDKQKWGFWARGKWQELKPKELL